MTWQEFNQIGNLPFFLFLTGPVTKRKWKIKSLEINRKCLFSKTVRGGTPRDCKYEEAPCQSQVIGKVSPNYQTSPVVYDCFATVVTRQVQGSFSPREKKKCSGCIWSEGRAASP